MTWKWNENWKRQISKDDWMTELRAWFGKRHFIVKANRYWKIAGLQKAKWKTIRKHYLKPSLEGRNWKFETKE